MEASPTASLAKNWTPADTGQHEKVLMNRHALAVLEFPAVLDHVATYAATSLGAAALVELRPATDAVAVRAELARVEEVCAFLQSNTDWAMPTLPDIRSALDRLAIKGSSLDASTLRDTGVVLRVARETKRAIARTEGRHPALEPITASLCELPALEERLRRAIDDAGEVRDDASRELKRLRAALRGARSRIVRLLEQFAASLPDRFRVPDASVSVRDGRFVIAVRREARAHVGGLVHDESATGGTLFVEPPPAIEAANEMREHEHAEYREVQRVLRELTDVLRPHADALDGALRALILLDSLQARARYALAVDGIRPDVGDLEGREFVVVNGRHPLLLAAGAQVVPFDLTLDSPETTLLVSGPNTGGKTVLLKTVGLISIMAQAGLIPPVGKGTRLPLFHTVFADIGDEQSIAASLSTFSAHLKNLREIVDGADAASLVLIDEIGSGTDPAEGAALAEAILCTLTERRARTVVTTHLGQLKLLAGALGGLVNASLQFDAVALEPTFRLIKGVPGRSYGLAIARRLGFPEAILTVAENAMPQEDRDVARLLQELEERDAQLARATEAADLQRSEAEHLRQEAESLRVQLEDREATVDRRERSAERTARQRARELLLDARKEVERTVEELRQAVSTSDPGALEDAIHAARRRIEEQAQAQRDKAPDLDRDRVPQRQDPDVGANVRVRATGAEGTIIELREGRALVDTGGARLSVPVSALEPVAAGAARPAPTRRRGGWTSPDLDAAPEIDIRGLRAEEVESTLMPALDAAIQAGLPDFRIIHGKGTGALREVVTEALRSDSRIPSFRPGGVGEGGTGVTVAKLS